MEVDNFGMRQMKIYKKYTYIYIRHNCARPSSFGISMVGVISNSSASFRDFCTETRATPTRDPGGYRGAPHPNIAIVIIILVGTISYYYLKGCGWLRRVRNKENSKTLGIPRMDHERRGISDSARSSTV